MTKGTSRYMNIRCRINTVLRECGIKSSHSNTVAKNIMCEVSDYILSNTRCNICDTPVSECRNRFGHENYHFIQYKHLRRMLR